MPSNHLILCHPLLIFLSIKAFSSRLALCIRWPKCWSFSYSISLSIECSGLISFRIDWLDLLAVQETLQCLLQHQSSKVLILQCSVFFMAKFSHLYISTGEIVALTIWTFVSKAVSLCFNMPSRSICFLRSKCLLISRQQSPSTVILRPKKINSITVSIVFHLSAIKWWELNDLIFIFLMLT